MYILCGFLEANHIRIFMAPRMLVLPLFYKSCSDSLRLTSLIGCFSCLNVLSSRDWSMAWIHPKILFAGHVIQLLMYF